MYRYARSFALRDKYKNLGKNVSKFYQLLSDNGDTATSPDVGNKVGLTLETKTILNDNISSPATQPGNCCCLLLRITFYARAPPVLGRDGLSASGAGNGRSLFTRLHLIIRAQSSKTAFLSIKIVKLLTLKKVWL